MSLRIGLYDFFAYTLPGVFYVFVTIFGLTIFGIVDINFNVLKDLSLLPLLLLVVSGYLLGLLLDPIAFKWLYLFKKNNDEARKYAFKKFHDLHPQLRIDFEPNDWPIMFHSIKNASMDLAMDIEQHNVASILFRNLSFGLAIVTFILLLFFLLISLNFWNLILAGVSFYFSMLAIKRGDLRRYWFYLGIFEAFAAIFLLDKDKLGTFKSLKKIKKIMNEKENI